ncbi:MAG: alpha/beta hydrolase [Bacteroidaceae bacterium]
MKKNILFVCTLFALLHGFAADIETVWPKGKMPHRQDHQIAAMLDMARDKDFNPEKHRVAYIEWMPAPDKSVRTDACMILISGGGYYTCCDMGLVDEWNKRLTQEGIQCVKFVYRTPRPEGLPIYQTAWEDAQRAVRMIRSEAKKRGFNPEKIGVISQSAGSHLALLLATSSQTPAYEPVDALDTVSCHINWAIVNSPAYVTTDGQTGTPATRQGYGLDIRLSDIYKFDSRTCPMSLHHGGADEYSPNGSTLIYRELRKRGVPAELHLYPNRPHGAYGLERAVEFMHQMEFYKPLEPEVELMSRFISDDACAKVIEADVWPEGKVPDLQENQCKPVIKWYFPKEKKTDAIQIIYSGGSYMGNNFDGFEVAPARRYLNELGMTVVTMRYRTPRPKGLPKHLTAWQDLQRAVRIVRSEASKYGLDGTKVGIMGSSAGGHLTLMGVTSSMHQSYLPIDDIDRLPCNVQWGIGIYPAYALKDGADGHNSGGGNSDDDTLVPEFSFDLNTSPMLFIHGDADGYASMGSVKVWEKMRSMGIQSELHTLALRQHCFQVKASPGTGSYTWLDRIAEYLREMKILN